VRLGKLAAKPRLNSNTMRFAAGDFAPLTAQSAARLYPWPRKGGTGEPGREPANSERSTHVRFGAHSGLKSDITAVCDVVVMKSARPQAATEPAFKDNNCSSLLDGTAGLNR
jgi:hypothetical protein